MGFADDLEDLRTEKLDVNAKLHKGAIWKVSIFREHPENKCAYSKAISLKSILAENDKKSLKLQFRFFRDISTMTLYKNDTLIEIVVYIYVFC